MRCKLIVLWVVMTMLLLNGCGRNEELDVYKSNMETFFSNVSILDESINGIDPEAQDAAQRLLGYLDQLQTGIEQMASLTVPEQFEGVDILAKEAAENMQMANELFHQAYAEDGYKANVADAALQYYGRVNVRIHYIISILHGELPEE